MILQLYSDFSRLTGQPEGRICPLPDAITADVRHELNGEWTLTVEYPSGGLHAAEIKNGRVIMAPGNGKKSYQAFDIRSIVRGIAGTITVTAYHVSYRFGSVICRPWLNGGQPVTAYQAWQKTIDGMIGQHVRGYTHTGPDRSTDEGVHLLVPTPFRAVVRDVLVKYYGGIARYDNLNLDWDLTDQAQRAIVVTQRVNMIDLTQSAETQDIESGIVPYYGRADDESKPIIMPTVSIDYGLGVPLNVVPVDLTSSFEETPTLQQLLLAADAYKARRISEIIEASVSITAVPTDKLVEPGDLVEIVTDIPGAIGTRQVTEITYDCLTERTTSVSTGPTRRNLSSAIASLK